MQATCIRIEQVEEPPSKAHIGKIIQLNLHVLINGQPVTINLGVQLRPLIGGLRSNRRRAAAATMPSTIAIEKRGGQREHYVVAQHEIRYWAEQIRHHLSSPHPFLQPTIP